MGSWQYPQWQPYPQTTTNKTLDKLKLCAFIVKNQATLLDLVVKGWERNKSKEMILQSKTQNLWHLNHLHYVFNANGLTILLKKVGAVPMPQIDPNGSNRSIQQTLRMTGKVKENWTTQDLHHFSNTFSAKKPRLQWADYTSVRQYVISDPPTIV